MRRIRRAAAAAVIAIVAMPLTACSFLPPIGRPTPTATATASGDAMIGLTRYPVGERKPAPDIRGTTLAGTPYALADQRGTVVVLNSWASWCEPCKDELPLLVQEHATAPAGVTFVGLNVNDTVSSAQAMVQRYGVTWPSVVDNGARLLATIPGVPPGAVPSTVVIDKQGRIAARVIGRVKPGMLAPVLAELTAEQ